MNPNQPPVPAEDNRSELNKLGSGQPVDHAKLHEQMEESLMDRLLESLKSIEERPK